MSDVISSRSNPTVVAVRRLAENRPEDRCLLEGPILVGDAIEAGVVLESLFVIDGDTAGLALAERAGVQATLVTADVLTKLSTTETPQSPVAVARVPVASLDVDRPLLVLWEVADPGNAGTLIRTAAAFGFQVAVVGGADPWAPKCVRAGAGGHFRTPIARVDAPAGIGLMRDWHPVATVPRGGREPATLAGLERPAIIVGNEAHGLPEEVVAASTTVTIPMHSSTESINAAQAGAVLMWEWSRTPAG